MSATNNARGQGVISGGTFQFSVKNDGSNGVEIKNKDGKTLFKLDHKCGGNNDNGRQTSAPQLTHSKECTCAECFKLFKEASSHGSNTFKEGGDHVMSIVEKTIELCGKRQQAEPVVHQAPETQRVEPVYQAPAPEPNEPARWWVWLIAAIALFLLIGGILWAASNLALSSADESLTPAQADPCCMTPEEVLDLQERTLEMHNKHSSKSSPVVVEELDYEEDEDLFPVVDNSPNYFGQFRSADPDLTLKILTYLSGPQNPNFRFIAGDSLDGENKFVMRAIQVATLIQNGWGVRFPVDKPPELHRTNYDSRNLLPEAGRMARAIGDHTKYRTSYQNEESFYFVVNSALSGTPSSSETDFSKAVEETLDLLMEKVQDEQIPSVNGRVTFAVNTSNARGATRTPRKKSVSPSRLTNIPSNFYQNPVPGSTWKNKHWDGKTYAVDMMAKKGTPVYASSGGKVIRSGYGGKKSGNRVTVRDSNADIFYGHLDEVSVKLGQNVRKGQLIGRVGHTGSAKASAPHLHFEVFNRRVTNFPRPWLKWTQPKHKA